MTVVSSAAKSAMVVMPGLAIPIIPVFFHGPSAAERGFEVDDLVLEPSLS
jgi:hypothetical protein